MAIATHLPGVFTVFVLISTSPSLLSVQTLSTISISKTLIFLLLFSSVVSHPSRLQLPLGDTIKGSPGSRPGSIVTGNRVHIHGLSRLHNLDKNASIGVGMCSEAQWQKVPKVLWVHSVSPFEDRILDIRMLPDPSRSIEVSTEHGHGTITHGLKEFPCNSFVLLDCGCYDFCSTLLIWIITINTFGDGN